MERTVEVFSHKEVPGPTPVGIFDSGVGGLSILVHLQEQIPYHPLYYVADQAHVPYGSRTVEEIQTYSFAISRFLMSLGCRVIVVACNTASAASLEALRNRFQDIAFVGMEPAVKPAANHTHTGVVGVLATPATFNGKLYASVVERFGQNVSIMQNSCPGLVEEIEAGRAHDAKAREILTDAIAPMLENGVDTLVLGCTHYPFAMNLIRDIAGPGMDIIDPSPAVARRTANVLEQRSWLKKLGTKGKTVMYTTGSVDALSEMLPGLLTQRFDIKGLCWQGNKLYEVIPPETQSNVTEMNHE